MKFGISMWSFVAEYHKGNMSVEQFIAYAAQHGYEFVELLDYFWKDAREDIAKAREVAKRHGIDIGVYSIGNDFAHVDANERRTAVAYVQRGTDQAAEIGAPVLRIFGGSPKPGLDFARVKSWLLDALRECADYAAGRKVTLAMENHGTLSGRSEQILELIREVNSSWFRATADTGNFLLVDEQPLHAIRQLAPYIAHVHCKDFALIGHEKPHEVYTSVQGKKYLGCAIGEGAAQIGRILTFLKQQKYDATISLEYEGVAAPYSGVAQSQGFIKQYL
jgi:sugar phosphate isomerase/epimerase